MTSKLIFAAVAAAVLAGLYYLASPRSVDPAAAGRAPGDTIVAVQMPPLGDQERIGQAVFRAKCSGCHGADAGGIEGSGPPLIHAIYEPNHHGDMAIVLAAERGVQSHHWRFGNMPPVEGVTRADLVAVIDFIRKVQKANGIF